MLLYHFNKLADAFSRYLMRAMCRLIVTENRMQIFIVIEFFRFFFGLGFVCSFLSFYVSLIFFQSVDVDQYMYSVHNGT